MNYNDINISFAGLLTLLFIGLKLGNVIDWSWWWVLAPLWIPFAFVIAIFLICLVVAVLLRILFLPITK